VEGPWTWTPRRVQITVKGLPGPQSVGRRVSMRRWDQPRPSRMDPSQPLRRSWCAMSAGNPTRPRSRSGRRAQLREGSLRNPSPLVARQHAGAPRGGRKRSMTGLATTPAPPEDQQAHHDEEANDQAEAGAEEDDSLETRAHTTVRSAACRQEHRSGGLVHAARAPSERSVMVCGCEKRPPPDRGRPPPPPGGARCGRPPIVASPAPPRSVHVVAPPR